MWQTSTTGIYGTAIPTVCAQYEGSIAMQRNVTSEYLVVSIKCWSFIRPVNCITVLNIMMMGSPVRCQQHLFTLTILSKVLNRFICPPYFSALLSFSRRNVNILFKNPYSCQQPTSGRRFTRETSRRGGISMLL